MFDRERHHRQSLRLVGYNYRLNGGYFVTICLQDRACLFGQVVDDEMRINEAGAMILHWWERLPTKWSGIETDVIVVMPNHMHGIVVINDSFWTDKDQFANGCGGEQGDHAGSPLPEATRPRLGDVIGWFKTMMTNAYIRGVEESGWEPFPGRLWQRNYYEHIIRNEQGLEFVRAYIDANPARWAEDEENPARIPPR